MEVYEIESIERHTGLTEADSMRIGRRYHIGVLAEGYRAILPHADDPEKALLTSNVKYVTNLKHGNIIVFTTKNTTYTLRKVGDGLSEIH